ncbi:hypothetical protein EDD16DRAFT_1526776 [Pisolithus croceorrhizus]|nr:hypothetical protein EDD16DRAFT_1526776 [Pisolithus croceorrhizus]KAI6113337.1 hypothetical protein EV401DRAFT_1890275 [Pisolithus croceorrhizus]KAI6150142.1 hypothetical protein EDD17DRAFT_1513612 [Pisolithus thermaeus]
MWLAWVVGGLLPHLQLLALPEQWYPQERLGGTWPVPLQMSLVVGMPQWVAVGPVLLMMGLASGLYMTALSGGGSWLEAGLIECFWRQVGSPNWLLVAQNQKNPLPGKAAILNADALVQMLPM